MKITNKLQINNEYYYSQVKSLKTDGEQWRDIGDALQFYCASSSIVLKQFVNNFSNIDHNAREILLCVCIDKL